MEEKLDSPPCYYDPELKGFVFVGIPTWEGISDEEMMTLGRINNERLKAAKKIMREHTNQDENAKSVAQ